MSIRDELVAVKATVRMVRLLNDNGFRLSDDVNQQIKCFNHDDVEPSARVYPNSDSVFCWSCHKVWDVVAATQTLKKLSFNDAVRYLVENYGVDVKASPSIITNFYRQANDYMHGDPIKVTELVKKFGDDFRTYYERIIGWQHAQGVIDYCWSEYDEMYGMSLSPKHRARLIVQWYNESISLVASYVTTCKNLQELKEKAEAAGFK